MDPYVDNAPRNWIPPRKQKTLNQDSKTVGERECDGPLDESMKSRTQHRFTSNMMRVKAKEMKGKENEDSTMNHRIDGRNWKEGALHRQMNVL